MDDVNWNQLPAVPKCRTCMRGGAEYLQSIFELKQIQNEEEVIQIACMLNILTSLEFQSENHLPTQICDECSASLCAAYAFRQMCIRSDGDYRNASSDWKKEETVAENEGEESEVEELILLEVVESQSPRFEYDVACEEVETLAAVYHEEQKELIDNIVEVEIFKEEPVAEQPEEIVEEKLIDDPTQIQLEEKFDVSLYEEEESEEELVTLPAVQQSPDGPRKMNNKLLVHKCPKCKKCFDREDKMRRHAKIHNVPEEKYFCEYCSKGYKMLQTYKSHMKSHDPNNANKCSFCNSVFVTNYELERHVRIHTGEKPFKCDECGKGFAQRNGLVRHLVNFHKKDIGYSEGYGKTPHKKKPCLCEICGAEKKNSFALKIHMRQHTGEKPHQCEICSKGFVVPFQLKVHMRSHTGEKPHQCDMCSKSFSQRIGLNVHRRTHTGEKPCVCDICDKAFTVPSHLKMHMRSHTGEKPYRCEVCGKGFTQNTILQNHIKSHTGNTYNCVYCKKAFNQKHNLKRHMKIHTGEKPYECQVCSRRFSEKLSMKYHVQTHSGEKPYSKLSARLKAKKTEDDQSYQPSFTITGNL